MYESQELKRKYRELVREISELKRKLVELDKEREFWFNKKESLKKEIRELIKKLKSIKLKNGPFYNINEMKKQRGHYETQIRNLMIKLKQLYKEANNIFRKHKIKEDPLRIQERIEAIEKQLEVEVSFEREKKLMKKLKQLKELYKQSKTRKLIEQIDKLKEEISNLRKKAKEFHRRMEQAIKIKDGYGKFIELSRRINELRKQQEEAFNKFIQFKREFASVNNLLKEKLEEAAKLQQRIEIAKLPKQKQLRALIKTKAKDVLEKLKKKKRLETEDLLILQEAEKEKE